MSCVVFGSQPEWSRPKPPVLADLLQRPFGVILITQVRLTTDLYSGSFIVSTPRVLTWMGNVQVYRHLYYGRYFFCMDHVYRYKSSARSQHPPGSYHEFQFTGSCLPKCVAPSEKLDIEPG